MRFVLLFHIGAEKIHAEEHDEDGKAIIKIHRYGGDKQRCARKDNDYDLSDPLRFIDRPVNKFFFWNIVFFTNEAIDKKHKNG